MVIMEFTRMSREIIQVRLNDVSNVMERIRHCSLKCGPIIHKAKRELFIREGSSWIDKGCLILITQCNVYLAVSRKNVHKGKEFTPTTFINDLVNEGSGVIILRTNMIEIMLIYAKMNNALFLCHQ